MGIPFNRPRITGRELDYITEAIGEKCLSGDGKFTKKCNSLLERMFVTSQALITTSCTHALEMASILCGIKSGDEFILPSYTFSSTANAFILHGARPRFIDIRPDTLNMDERQVESELSVRTRVVVPVHYAGVGVEMDSILDTAVRHGLRVVEDAAQAIGASYKGKALGTFGDLGCFSFHETKNVVCGEGGAILIRDGELVERAEIIREKGTNRSKFHRGEVDKYTWVDIGSSYLPSEIVAAFLLAQLESMDELNRGRHQVFSRYHEAFAILEEKGNVKRPFWPSYCNHNAHMYYLILNSEKTRDALMNHLKSKGILAVFHYIPLHLSPMGERFGYKKGMLPITEDLSLRLLRLPLFPDLDQPDQQKVISEVFEFFR